MPKLNKQYILVTRPLPQGQALVEMIKAAGGAAVLWPCIELRPAPAAKISQAIAELPNDGLVIFVSPTAARMVWQALTVTLRDKLHRMQLFAVGEGTANILHSFGCKNVIYPKARANSEALLALPELQDMTNRLVIICRGQDGRELIAETLQQRGANIQYVRAYDRHPPSCNPQNLIAAWQAHGFSLVILTSVDSLYNLANMLGDQRHLLQQTPITVMSERMAMAARNMGIQQLHYVNSASNNDLLTFIKKIDKK